MRISRVMSAALTSSDDLCPARRSRNSLRKIASSVVWVMEEIRQLGDTAFEGLLEGGRVEGNNLSRRRHVVLRLSFMMASLGLG